MSGSREAQSEYLFKLLGVRLVGPAVETASGDLVMPVTRPPLLARTATVKDNKKDWKVGDAASPPGITLAVSGGTIVNVKVVAPPKGVFAAVGDAVPVSFEIAADATHAATVANGTVKVVKGKPAFRWAAPRPVLVNTALTATQLCATPPVPSLPLVYAPALGTKLTVAGKATLEVSTVGDANYEAATTSVTIVVAATAPDLASETGAWDALNGKAFKPTTNPAAIKLIEAWNKDDGSSPTGIKTQARKIMSDIKTMTSEELLDYMDQLVTTPTDKVEQTLNKKGNPATFPNTIWKLPNGLQVRYKPKGDGITANGPMFCIEGRTSTGFSATQDDIAFKIMPNGGCGPKGPGETLVPPSVANNPVLNTAYMSGACGQTHLQCLPKQAQIITWANPADIYAGTKLGPTQLNATALGNAVLTYTPAAGNELAVKAGHVLKVTAAATKRYLATTVAASVTINCKAKEAQAITWANPADIVAGAVLGDTQLNATALGSAVLTYTPAKGTVLKVGDRQRLKVQAAPTTQYLANEKTVVINVKAKK